jgi:hypothetical protein
MKIYCQILDFICSVSEQGYQDIFRMWIKLFFLIETPFTFQAEDAADILRDEFVEIICNTGTKSEFSISNSILFAGLLNINDFKRDSENTSPLHMYPRV